MKKMCPLKTNAIQAEFARLKAVPKLCGVSLTYAGAMEQARREFGQCDEEKCAWWESYLNGQGDEVGQCVIQNLSPIVQ